MKITRLKINRIINPMGFELKSLSASWVTEETSAKKQKWARVEVAADPAFQTLLWDSGEQEGLSSVDCPLPITTQPRTRYWWRVTVCADNGETAVSEPAWFETAKGDEPWQGKWITTGQDDIHPLLRRTFTLEEEPVCTYAPDSWAHRFCSAPSPNGETAIPPIPCCCRRITPAGCMR